MSSKQVISTKAAQAVSPLLMLLAFFIPLSTSASSVAAMLVILAWLLSGDYKEKFSEIGRNPLAIAILCYIALNIIGLLWTEDMHWGIKIVKKQWKLLLFPIFLTATRKEHIPYYLIAFIGGIFIIACKAYLVWLGLITLPPGSIHTTVGTSHIYYNPLLALVIYILLQRLLFFKNSRVASCLLTILVLFFTCNMFITAGRTGQAVFFILLIVLLFQFFYKKSKTKLFLSLLFIPLLAGAIYQFSPTFKHRINTAIAEAQDMQSQVLTSVGGRLWFLQNSWRLLKQNKLTGVGTGDFPIEYAKINNRYSPKMQTTNNPHNQYLLTAIQFGMAGLILLLAIFGSQFLFARSHMDSFSQLRMAFLIFFLVIMLAESYLLIHATGLLFSLFCAFLYKDFEHVKTISAQHP